jgi:hypothetical protein
MAAPRVRAVTAASAALAAASPVMEALVVSAVMVVWVSVAVLWRST